MIPGLDLSPRLAFTVWVRNFTVYRKTWKMNILPNFFEPVFYLVAMGIGLGAYLTRAMEGVSYLTYIAPGLIVASAMNGATFETTYNVFVKMHFAKTYQAITATPVNLEDAVLGEALWGVTRGLVYGSIFALVTALFGLAGGWRVVFMLPVILVTAWLFAGLGLLFTSFIRVIDLYAFYYTLWLTPLFLFSGIFFPVSGLPAWAQAAAWFTPLYHCVNLGKAVAHGGAGAAFLADAAWVVVVGSLANYAAIRRFVRASWR